MLCSIEISLDILLEFGVEICGKERREFVVVIVVDRHCTGGSERVIRPIAKAITEGRLFFMPVLGSQLFRLYYIGYGVIECITYSSQKAAVSGDVPTRGLR